MADPRDRALPPGLDAALALQQSEARLRLMIDAVPAMITYVDAEERYLFCNKPYVELIGKPADQILGHSLREVLGDEVYAILEPRRKAALAGVRVQYERRHERSDGRLCDLSVTFLPNFDEHGAVAGFFSLTLDITELKTLERRLAHMAQHDVLTGLPNRALYDDRLARAVERCRRHGEPFALACLDIDHFKRINDTHGHAVGDALLREFAARLARSVRAVDTAARIGGDEFAVILEGPITPAAADTVANKILAAMREPLEIDGLRLSITTSIGIAIATPADLSGQAIASQADAALYRAKGAGRDRFVR